MLFGESDGKETLDLPYADHQEYVKDYDARYAAWKIGGRVSFRGNPSVLIAIALERIQAVDAGGPLLVSSNEIVSQGIRSLIVEAKKLDDFPEGISDTIASLSEKHH